MKIINVFIVTATVCIAGYIIHLFISPGYPFSDYTQIPSFNAPPSMENMQASSSAAPEGMYLSK